MDFVLKCLQKQEQKLDELKSMLLDQKKVLTFDEAAIYTGFSKSHLYKLTSGSRIPHFKPHGKMIFFNKEDIDNWLLKNPVKTIDAIEMEAANFASFKRSGGGR